MNQNTNTGPLPAVPDATQLSIWRRLFGIDLRTLALFRVAIATVLCGDLIERLIHVRFYYTDDGLLPRQAIDQIFGSSIKWTSLHYHTGSSVGLQSFMLVLSIALAVCLLVGYRTRIATVLSWLLFISLNRRVSSMCTGGDDLMRLMLIWSFFLPLGARWSIDSLRHYADGNTPTGDSNRFYSAATWAILLQLAYVYFFTAIIKFAGPAWLDGSAVQEALQFEVHVRPAGLWLSEKTSFLYFLTYATLFAELLMPLLVFSPVLNPWARWLAIITMISFHLGIFTCLTIGTFPFVCMACWLLFVPTETWDWLAARSGRKPMVGSISNTHFPFERSRIVQAVVVSMLFFITLYNILGIEQLNRRGIGVPGLMTKIAKLTRLDQKWKMYAPYPASTDGWFMMPSLLADGSTFDIYRNRPIRYVKPKVISAEFPTARIKKLFLVHRRRNTSPLWMWTMKYFADLWNESHPNQQVTKTQMTFIGEDTHNAKPYAFPYMEYDVNTGQFTQLAGENLIGLE